MANSWVWPTSHIDPGDWWNDEALAYDQNPSTYAYPDKPPRTGWTGYIEFYHNAVIANAARFSFIISGATIAPRLIWQVHVDGGWVTIWDVDGLGSGTYTKSFTEGLVTGMRLKLKYYRGFPTRPFKVTVNQVQTYESAPPGYGTILKHCLDQDSNPVAGVEIDLLDSTPVTMDTQTSGEDGIATFENLAADTYTVDVTRVPDGYIIDSLSEAIVVEAGETVNAYNDFMMAPPRLGAVYFLLA